MAILPTAKSLCRTYKASAMASSKNKSVGSYLAIGSKSASVVLKNLPYVLFLGFLTVVYIANAHFAEKQVRKIQVLQEDVRELKRQYNALKSGITFNSRLRNVGGEVNRLGLRKIPGRVKRIKLED